MSTAEQEVRTERDLLGSMQLPRSALYGIHTARAAGTFRIAAHPVHPRLIAAYGCVKLACFRVNCELGVFGDQVPVAAIEQACGEMLRGELDGHIVVDALQGGAGTSTNMNVNEVLANRALQIAGLPPGSYNRISPLDTLNRHQSTNDTFPTALRIAAITMLRELETALIALQEAFQAKEREYAGVVKIGRTQLQDAVLITLGREMGAFAEAFNRDRWRTGKCEERLRVINLGGTAAGTGLGAPRRFIFRATEVLRDITGLGLARAENLMDATSNADPFAEVSGILKTLAVSLVKVCTDLRLLSSGPRCGLGEIRLAPLQAGSSIMPAKVNPVVPEAVTQAALMAMGNDTTLCSAAAGGNLQLNQFMPLIAHTLLGTLDLLTNACRLLAGSCVATIEADTDACARGLRNPTALLTALVAHVGYEKASAIAHLATEGVSIREAALSAGMSEHDYDELLTPENVCRLGSAALYRTG